MLIFDIDGGDVFIEAAHNGMVKVKATVGDNYLVCEEPFSREFKRKLGRTHSSHHASYITYCNVGVIWIARKENVDFILTCSN